MDTSKFDELKRIIDNLYNADTLQKIYSEYLNKVFDVVDINNGKKLKKNELTNHFALVCSDAKLFEKLLSILPEDVYKILNILVWEGDKYPIEKFINEFGSKIAVNNELYYSSNRSLISKPYLLFNYEFDYSYYSSLSGRNHYKVTIFLNDYLRSVFKTYLPKPADYELIPIKSIDKTDFIYNGEDYIVRNIDLLKNYYQQGYVKIGKNEKVLKTSIQQMANYCHINEFYEQNSEKKIEQLHKELQFMKTEFIIDIFMTNLLKSNNKTGDKVDDKDGLEFLKSQFVKFFDDRFINVFDIFHKLMRHIKGYSYTYNYDSDRHYEVKKGFSILLATFPTMQWLSIDNIVKYSKSRDIYIEMVGRRSYDLSRLSVQMQSDEKTSRGYNEISLKNLTYQDVVTMPFIKGMLFLMASFGIVDIAYNYPSNQSYQVPNKKYLTLYDGLKYVRLTKLGAYLLGITDKYEAKITKEDADITLDDNRLMLRIEGSDPFKEMLLEKLSEKVHANNYKLTYSSFLKDCITIKDVEQKIKLFKKHISSKPSEIWQTFFKDVRDKINPLTPKTSLVVYEIQPNSELVNLIAKDAVLRKYILKAEKYHIVLDTANRAKVKKRLEEFGFFIDNL
ncbi:MAG: hypothetical protein HQK71_05000 [Desulfamplus sp.]|nr:hypothetical protein [Desulfamplus sp.]